MPEFKRSRLERKKEEQTTKKTVWLGVLTISIFILIIAFGLPLLIRFSILLGNSKSNKDTTGDNVLAPLAPRLIVPFEATNSSKIKVEGFAESESIVELLKNQESVGKVNVTQNGDFSFENIDLNEGENSFSAVAIKDKSGSSQASDPIIVVFDNKKPELTMSNPKEETVTADLADFDIIGKSESGASVLVNNRVAVVDDEGNFKIKIQLNSGKNDIEIIVRDIALNETRKTVSITY